MYIERRERRGKQRIDYKRALKVLVKGGTPPGKGLGKVWDTHMFVQRACSRPTQFWILD